MSLAFYTCKVTQAGPASDGQDGPTPVIYIKLSDLANPPAFTGKVFYAAEAGKSEMLTVAINAITHDLTVAVYTDPVGSPDAYLPIYRMYLGEG